MNAGRDQDGGQVYIEKTERLWLAARFPLHVESYHRTLLPVCAAALSTLAQFVPSSEAYANVQLFYILPLYFDIVLTGAQKYCILAETILQNRFC